MGYEKGGRADKEGNRFENNWILYNLLQVIEEGIQYVMIEAIGEDEEGVDLWIGNWDGSREGQQCKGRYGSEESWSYGTLNAKGIWAKWKKQLEREEKVEVALVSPLSFTQLEDLSNRARNTNGSANDFYMYQIHNKDVSKEIKQLYEKYCNIMEIDYSYDVGILQSIDYLSRTYYRQRPDFESKQIVLDKIYVQFIGNSQDIYDKLLRFILTEDILGKKIDLVCLNSYLSDCGVEYRNLAKDTRILPRVKKLNDEYSRNFISFQNGMIVRPEFETCKKMIYGGQSFIIHGNAGTGKSGCTENIIDFCKCENIPYLAIKLDRRVPKDTSENWGRSMGLTASPALCIDSISKNSKAILILDQLDALRWTQAHSGNALDVCMETIKEVERLNKGRVYNISIVFVIRTYDLLNDRGIKSLFSEESDYKEIEWNKLKIGELSQDVIKTLTGDEFNKLSQETKKLLEISSNMYIWQHLNETKERLCIDTTRRLVNEWWRQMQLKAEKAGLDAKYLMEIKNRMVSFCNENGRINVPNAVIQISANYIDFLQSNGFIFVFNEVVSFTHQSILDIFLSDYMVREYYFGKDIIDIVGDKKKQIPGKRYQLQLFMEQMLQTSESDFLKIGKKVLISETVRFSFKFVFLEILAMIKSPSKLICEYVCQTCKDILWGRYFIDNVIAGNKEYISSMQEMGILETWLENNDKKKTVIRLYGSIANSLDNKHLEMIKKHIFQDEETLEEWSKCFPWKITEDSDELFDLRTQFYEKYPRYLDDFLITEDMFKECEMRTIRLLILMLKEKKRRHERIIYKFEEEFWGEDTKTIVNEYETIIKMFLPLLPELNDVTGFDEWSARYSYHIGLERTCIQILKKANARLARTNAEEFWVIYKKYMYTGYDLYNEIILDGLFHLPVEYADRVIEYLCADFNLTIFEETSGNFDRLLNGKRLLEKVSSECSEEFYNILEKNIIKYIDKYAVSRLKYRIECNRERRYQVHWRFWGDFQRECLSVLPEKRLSEEAQQLLKMFARCNEKYYSIYKYSGIRSGGISSPIKNKTISYEAWKGILTNSAIPVENSHNAKWRAGECIEASQREFASSLESAIKKEGVPFLEYILNIDLPISDIFVQRIYSAIADSEQLNEIDITLIEKLIEKFGYNYEDYRAMGIVGIFENRKNSSWNENALSVLFDIALNHKKPEVGKPAITPQEDKEILLVDSINSNAINSVRSRALRAIAKLIWDDDKMAERFLEPIRKAIADVNPVMRYASQFALWPIYNIDRKWTSEQILSLYEDDVRMAGFYDGRGMLIRLYTDYRQNIIVIVHKMFVSKDKRLIKTSGHTIVDLYLEYDEFKEIVMGTFEFTKEQKEAVLEMLIAYVEEEDYRERAKAALIQNVNDSFDIEYPWTRLFYDKLVDMDKDEEFINVILSSVIGRRVLDAFLDFVEETGGGLRNYANLILRICKNLVEIDREKDGMLWSYQENISKMVISLYDAYSDNLEEDSDVVLQCLDLWDVMYEKQIGMARELTKKMMEM